ncbi:hypothetical protein MWU60_01785 [Yoonia sp. F2084L]|uniref:hypothetical protein n=1 Tax=Yoonia sp. F2084L TaxID=2926419 RepID=UPI001FF6CBE1|nr:hypothetical protein [Yoonia sp. F2084L]MCK0094287.1 hypothetical protein [Yoonia sp. F2084L]
MTPDAFMDLSRDAQLKAAINGLAQATVGQALLCDQKDKLTTAIGDLERSVARKRSKVKRETLAASAQSKRKPAYR